MADEADMAQVNIDGAILEGLSRVKQFKSLTANGSCHYCSEDVRPSLLFCSGGECLGDYEREQRIKARAGR